MRPKHKIKDIARELGYKTAEFEKQMADPGILSRIRQDVQDGTAAGVRYPHGLY